MAKRSADQIAGDKRVDDFIEGRLSPKDLKGMALLKYPLQEGEDRYLPIFSLRESINQRVQDLMVDRALVASYVSETGLYAFISTQSGTLIPVQSCRNMYLSSVWACFDKTPAESQNLIEEKILSPREGYPISVPKEWSFEHLHEMIRAYNFAHTQKSDTSVMYGNEAHFKGLALPDWMKGVRPLSGAKFA